MYGCNSCVHVTLYLKKVSFLQPLEATYDIGVEGGGGGVGVPKIAKGSNIPPTHRSQ